jgi:hypothetical protein
MAQASDGHTPGIAATMARLDADREWLAAQGLELSQFGPDPDSGKVRVYLTRYTEQARRAPMCADRKTGTNTDNRKFNRQPYRHSWARRSRGQLPDSGNWPLSCVIAVGGTRFELVTPSVSGKCSPAELTAREAEAGIEPAYRALQALA